MTRFNVKYLVMDTKKTSRASLMLIIISICQSVYFHLNYKPLRHLISSHILKET